MAGRQRGLAFHLEQTIGALPPGSPQQDRAKVENIRTKKGQRLLLGVVADGDGHADAGEAAARVVTGVFEQVRSTGVSNPAAAMRSALGAAGRRQGPAGQGGGIEGQVSATAAAVIGRRLYLAHVGHTVAYLVRGGKASALVRATPHPLSASGQAEIASLRAEGIALEPGDRIVVASDALTRPSPEDGKPFVDPLLIPRHVQDDPPLEAARHLISVAMGRDVDDNLTVLVIQIPGSAQRSPRPFILAVTAVALVAVAGGAAALLRWPLREVPPPPDLGYAVLLEGSARVDRAGTGSFENVSILGTIPAGSVLEAVGNIKLALKSTDSSVPELSDVHFWAVQGTRLRLKLLDAHPDPSSREQQGLRGLSVLGFEGGKILTVRRGGSRSYRVEAEGAQGEVGGTGSALLGVSRLASGISFDCLKDPCLVTVDAREEFDLACGERLVVSGAGEISRETVPATELAIWDELCGGCSRTP